MGQYKHHAIVVTGHDLQNVEQARSMIVYADMEQKSAWREGDDVLDPIELPMPVSPIVTSPETVYTCLIAPDGGKEGGETSQYGHEFREEAIRILKELHHCDWVEVNYAPDDPYLGETRVTRRSS